MIGFHTATLGARLRPIARQPRAAVAPRQAHHAGSTTPEIAGQINHKAGSPELFLNFADFRFETDKVVPLTLLPTLEARTGKKVEYQSKGK